MSDDPGQDFFSDGLTVDLITDLSRVSGIEVIPRHSSFVYRQDLPALPELGQKLKARYLVQGSVRRSAGQVRVNVQLVDVETEKTDLGPAFR